MLILIENKDKNKLSIYFDAFMSSLGQALNTESALKK